MLSRPVRSLRSPLAPSSRGQALSPRSSSHLRSCPLRGVIKGSLTFTRPAFPLAWLLPRMEQGPLGFFPGLRTPTGRTCGARQGGDGHRALARSYTTDIVGPPIRELARRCATSCRTDRPGHEPVPHPGAPGLLGEVRPRGQGVRRQTEGPGRTGHGNRYLARALGDAAAGAGRTKTFLGERYRRLAKRRGKQESDRRRRPLDAGHHLAPAVRPQPRISSTSAPTTTSCAAPTRPARTATTSANSKRSATRSASNPPPDSLVHPSRWTEERPTRHQPNNPENVRAPPTLSPARLR